ncbi:putative N-acetyltransferase YhbS [Bosea sp. OAE506]|uniref:GNAT family N-acetyltransferase n=1 Tax=Bosea sp. OAE506 TaxID=2663870 RepID=UPI00178BE558
MTSLPLTLRHELPVDAAAIERLHERAFGPGRFARTAFRLREGVPPDPALTFAAHVGTFLVGSIRVTPVMAGGHGALMLGPLTVDPAFEGRGIGAALMNRSIEAARIDGHDLILLVGDAPYYARFGFKVIPPGQLVLPGPADPARFLALELVEGVLAQRRGAVTAIKPGA